MKKVIAMALGVTLTLGLQVGPAQAGVPFTFRAKATNTRLHFDGYYGGSIYYWVEGGRFVGYARVDSQAGDKIRVRCAFTAKKYDTWDDYVGGTPSRAVVTFTVPPYATKNSPTVRLAKNLSGHWDGLSINVECSGSAA